MAPSSASPPITEAGRVAAAPTPRGLGLGWRRLRSRVARRVLLLFLLGASLPILFATLAATFALEETATQEARQSARAAARAGGQQILSRLQAAQELMADWPTEGHLEHEHEPVLAGRGRVFIAAAEVDSAGDGLFFSFGDSALLLPALWRDASGQERVRPAMMGGALLRSARLPDGNVRVLMARGDPLHPRWIAALAPEFVWDAIGDAQSSVRWEVQGPDGQTLFRSLGPEEDERTRTESWSIFLGAGFGSADWRVHYRYRISPPTLLGSSFSQWLISGSAVALLAAVLLAFTYIHRTMEPLEELERGTRALARRDYAARIRVQSKDEFHDLAEAFNTMAGRIDTQFRAMEHAGTIDRAVLAGAHPAQVADHVLGYLQSVLPDTDVAFMAAVGAATELRWRCVGEPVTHSSRQPGMLACDALARATPGGAWVDGATTSWSAPMPFGATRMFVVPIEQLGQVCGALVACPRGDDGSIGQALPLLRDLRDRVAVGLSATERRRELEHRAVRDALTGLANRRGLIEHLQAAAESDTPHAVLFVDLDRFKEVNDMLGHDVGDDVLIEAGGRLREVLPADALLARQGGDEFVAVVPEGSAQAAMALAEQIVAALGQPFVRRNQRFVLGASVGVAVAPQHGRGHTELLRRADLAMYAAKQRGRGLAELYDASLDAAALERTQLLSDLHAAIANQEFVVEFQPRIDAHDGRIVSAEALVRWQHPGRGLLLPWRFIPVAEESGLIEAIDALVMRKACAQWCRWSEAGIRLRRISVNVSARALGQGTLVDRVRDALAETGMPAQALEMEITETVLADGGQTVVDELNELRSLGVTLALDDFGTGYSAMAVLRRLPMDVIKIDRAFVKDLETDQMAQAVLGAIMVLAEALNLRTVAEGVETVAQRQMLESMQVDELQGFLFARPCTVEAFEALPALRREGESIVV